VVLPIRHRLTLWYTSLICVTFALAAAGLYLGLLMAVHRNADRELRLRLQGMEAFLGRESALSPDALADEIALHAGVRLNGDVYQLSRTDGSWLYRPASVSPLLLPSEPAASLGKPRFSNLSRDGKRYRILSALLNSGEHVYEVQLISNITPILDVLHGFILTCLAAMPVIVLAAWFGGHWLSGRALLPVRTLTFAAQRIGASNLNDRLPVGAAADELRDLAITMNSMLERLETAFGRVTRFTADASHELRTPLAVIRTATEMALERHRGPEEYREYLHHILHETEITTALIEDMLALARTDAEQGSQRLQEAIDLRSVILELEPALRRMAEGQSVEIRFDTESKAAPVYGERQSLRRLVLILMDNAIKYTLPHGKVNVRLRVRENATSFDVSDTGVGIAEGDLPHIFERFYRADAGRSRDAGGAGLGLSIAQGIAANHHATIEVQSEPDYGSTFTVCFQNEALEQELIRRHSDSN
jgi:heavy metal sensor kinase